MKRLDMNRLNIKLIRTLIILYYTYDRLHCPNSMYIDNTNNSYSNNVFCFLIVSYSNNQNVQKIKKNLCLASVVTNYHIVFQKFLFKKFQVIKRSKVRYLSLIHI